MLKSGVAGKSKALLKGKGPNLPDPLDMGPLGTPVTAQLLNYQSGVCWEGNFTTAKKDRQRSSRPRTRRSSNASRQAASRARARGAAVVLGPCDLGACDLFFDLPWKSFLTFGWSL